MPTPSGAIIAKIRAILKHHNILEKGPGGLDLTCDELAGEVAELILAKLQAAPE
jgi:hypothetical protein